jgi:N-acetylmuramoyl-L-alanine amidase
MREIKYIVFHCTAGSSTQSTQSIKQYWANKLGWKSYGYHMLVNADGSIEYLTPIDKTTNGVAGFNANSIHVCYKGGFGGKDTRTPQQKVELMRIASALKTKFPKAKLMGHRDFSKDLDGDGVIEPHEWVKLCPCFSVTKEYSHIK